MTHEEPCQSAPIAYAAQNTPSTFSVARFRDMLRLKVSMRMAPSASVPTSASSSCCAPPASIICSKPFSQQRVPPHDAMSAHMRCDMTSNRNRQGSGERAYLRHQRGARTDRFDFAQFWLNETERVSINKPQCASTYMYECT